MGLARFNTQRDVVDAGYFVDRSTRDPSLRVISLVDVGSRVVFIVY